MRGSRASRATPIVFCSDPRSSPVALQRTSGSAIPRLNRSCATSCGRTNTYSAAYKDVAASPGTDAATSRTVIGAARRCARVMPRPRSWRGPHAKSSHAEHGVGGDRQVLHRGACDARPRSGDGEGSKRAAGIASLFLTPLLARAAPHVKAGGDDRAAVLTERARSGVDSHHRDASRAHDACGHAPDEDASQASPSLGAHDGEVRGYLFGRSEHGVLGLGAKQERHDLDPCIVPRFDAHVERLATRGVAAVRRRRTGPTAASARTANVVRRRAAFACPLGFGAAPLRAGHVPARRSDTPAHRRRGHAVRLEPVGQRGRAPDVEHPRLARPV